MSKKANPTTIGLFVVIALALAVAGLLIFGSGTFFQKSTYYVLYFESSVGGLDVGAPVEFNGVRIGNVSEIKLVYDHQDNTVRIPVYIRLEPQRMSEVNAELAQEGSSMNVHVKRGLRARLQSQSFLTGKLKIELAYLPDTELTLSGQHDEYMELPTAPSTLAAITKKFDELPIAQIVLETHRTIQALGDIVESEEFRATAGNLNETINEVRVLAKSASDLISSEEAGTTVKNLNEALAEIQNLMTGLQESITSIAESFNMTSTAAAGAMGSVETALVEVTELIDDDSPLGYDMREAARELTDAARKIAALADLIERHPESLLKGKR
jgi:paraquat-inducible protein B